MKYSNTIKRPLLKSILLTLLILVFPVGAGVMITVLSLGDTAAMLVQAAFFAFAGLIGLIILKKSSLSYADAGLTKPLSGSARKLFCLTPIIIMEIMPLGLGLQNNLTAGTVLSILLFMACVGFAEELYFRGLILRTLTQQGATFGVLVSSLLFGAGHLSNLANGASLTLTLLQVLFAFLFGWVTAEIALLTKSLFITILWHFAHNAIATITAQHSPQTEIMLAGAQCIILLGYGAVLSRKRRQEQ